MPYGILPATSIFQENVEKLFADMKDVVVFVDDIAVTGKDKKTHLENLEIVLQRLRRQGIRVKKEKCLFLKNEIQLLGHIISAAGIKKIPAKVEKILKIENPSNTKEVKSLMGILNFYSKFIPNMATIMSPIYALTRKNVDFNWTEECSLAVSKIKKLLQKDIELAHFLPDCRTIVETDASDKGVAGVMFQIQNGIKRPIEYISRTLSGAEQNYCVTDKEGLAVYYTIKKFYEFLYGIEFELYCDHKPIVSIFGENKPIPHIASERRVRWANFLSTFNYKIKHIKGQQNHLADWLSRNPNDDSENNEINDEEDLQLNAIFADKLIERETLVQETNEDILLMEVKHQININWRGKFNEEIRPFYKIRNELTIEDELIMFGSRIVVPTKSRKSILTEMHSTHLGIVKMKSLVRSYVWWPAITKDIENMVNSCAPCYLVRQNPRKEKNVSWPKSKEPWERIHVDFLGPFENKYVFIIIDSYTKWPEAFIMSNITTTAAIQRLWETFSRFGIPKLIVSDNGTQLVSKEIKEFLANHGIRNITTPVKHPQSNGQAENSVKTFKNSLKKILRDRKGKTFAQAMYEHLLYYRNVNHCTTNRTPAQLMFNRKLRLKYDNLADKPREASETNYPSVREFKTNDEVITRDFRTTNKEKWVRGKVQKRIGRNVYLVMVGKLMWKRHVNQLQQILSSTEPKPARGESNEKGSQVKYYKRVFSGTTDGNDYQNNGETGETTEETRNTTEENETALNTAAETEVSTPGDELQSTGTPLSVNISSDDEFEVASSGNEWEGADPNNLENAELFADRPTRNRRRPRYFPETET